MSLLVQPADISHAVSVIGLIYGQPGLGKSTLALSIANSVCIDADKGMYRVQPRWRVASLPLNDYRDSLKAINGGDFNAFDAIVIDTLGKLVDRIGEYVISENPKSGRNSGVLNVQGWGDVKREFSNLLRMLRARGKHLIFVAHEKEEKEGDQRIVRPDVAGSSGKDLLKDLDFVGYMEARNGQATISFTPSEKFYAKNALKLPPVINVPDPEVSGKNDFLQKYVVEATRNNNALQSELHDKYKSLVDTNAKLVHAVKNAKEATDMIEKINGLDVIWDSTRQAKKALMDHAATLGLAWDKEAKGFVVAKEKPVDPNAQAAVNTPSIGSDPTGSDAPAAGALADTQPPEGEEFTESSTVAKRPKAKAKPPSAMVANAERNLESDYRN